MNLVDLIPLSTRRVLIDAPSGTVGVELTRAFAASTRELWEAITDPHRREHWFGPLDGAAPDVEVCEEEHLLRLPWEDGTLEISFADSALTVRHTVARDEEWETYGPALLGVGWDSALAALDLHLAVDAEAAEGEEEEFLRRLVDEWSADKQQRARALELFLA
ncbi:hypothetical protein [Corynebacterium nasicanis]|uniref:ATPase n=1 Tax=Corynebacterium nasicanis TaxID=1448267 RepID=A0ABW1QBN2_9CORY